MNYLERLQRDNRNPHHPDTRSRIEAEELRITQPRRPLKELGALALPFHLKGHTLRAIAWTFNTNPARVHRALQAVGAKPRAEGRSERRLELLRDGKKALMLQDTGRSVDDIVMIIGGSRARICRAMQAVRSQRGPASIDVDMDPMLL